MKKLLPLLLLILIGCSEPEPKDKLYNEESFKEDILLFSEQERELIGMYILRQEFIKQFSDNEILGSMVDESQMVNLSVKTYGEIIKLQTEFNQEQTRIDSLNKVEEEKRRKERQIEEEKRRKERQIEEEKRRVEEEKRRKLLLEQQNKYSKLIELTVLSVEESDSEFDFFNSTILKISMKSVESKKVNSLKFILKVFDKNNKLLGEGRLNSTGTFSDEKVGRWELNSMSLSDKLYGLLSGSSVDDYRYDFEFISFIYDGELIEFE